MCFLLKTVDWAEAQSETSGDTRVLGLDSIDASNPPELVARRIPYALQPKSASKGERTTVASLAVFGWSLRSRMRAIWNTLEQRYLGRRREELERLTTPKVAAG